MVKSVLMKTQPTQSAFAKGLIGKGRRNPRKEIEDTLDKESLNDFRAAMSNRAISVSAIIGSLKECGIDVSPSVIQKWREEKSKVSQ